MRSHYGKQTRRSSMEIPLPLKGIVEDTHHEDTMVLISAWERAVGLAREMEVIDTPGRALMDFISDNLRTPPLSKQGKIIFKIASMILEVFMRLQWPTLVSASGNARTQETAQLKASGWHAFILSITITLSSCLDKKSKAEQTKAIACLSPAATQCFSAICAGWPLREELSSEEHSQIVDFTASLVRLDKAFRTDYLKRKTHGLCALGVALFKSRSIELSFSLVCLVCDILPTLLPGRATSSKEVFSSTKFNSTQARELRRLLEAAADPKFHQNCNAILGVLATFGDDYPQPHPIQYLSSDGTAIVNANTETLEIVMWLENECMVARVFTGTKGDEHIEQCVYRYDRMTLFRLKALDQDTSTFGFGYESEDKRFHGIEIVVDTASTFAAELKVRCDKLEGCASTFHDDWRRMSKKSKASRVSEPMALVLPALDKKRRKTEPVQIIAGRQAVQSQNDDSSSMRRQESSPLSDLPPDYLPDSSLRPELADHFALREPALNRPKAKRKLCGLVHDGADDIMPAYSPAPSSVRQLPATQVKKRKIVTVETTEALDRQADSPRAPSPFTPYKVPGIAEGLPPARSVAPQATKPSTMRAASSPRQEALSQPKVTKHGINLSVKPNSHFPPSKTSKPAQAATVVEGPKITPYKRTPRQLRAAAKLTELAMHGIIKQPRESTPPSALKDHVQLNRGAQTKAKPAVLSMGKSHESDDDSEVDREIRRGMLQFAADEDNSRNKTPSPASKSRTPAAFKTYKQTPKVMRTTTSYHAASQEDERHVTVELEAQPVVSEEPSQLTSPVSLRFSFPESPTRTMKQATPELEMNSPLAKRMPSQTAAVGKGEPNMKSGAIATEVQAVLTNRKDGIGKVKQQNTHARKVFVKQKPVKILIDPRLTIDNLDQPAILQVGAKVVAKPVAPVQLPVFDALFAHLEGIHIALNEHFSSRIHQLKERGAAAAGLIAQEGKDLFDDEAERNMSAITTTSQVFHRLYKQEQQVIQTLQVVTGIGNETSKIIEASKQRAWKWPEL